MDKKQEFLKRILATFKLEAEENINAMSSQILELEDGCSPERKEEILELIYRSAHSLKGASRAVSLGEIGSLCHAFEDVMSAIRNDQIEISQDILDLFNEVIDLLNEILFENDGQVPPSLTEKFDHVSYSLSCAEMGEPFMLQKKGASEAQSKPAPKLEESPQPDSQDILEKEAEKSPKEVINKQEEAVKSEPEQPKKKGSPSKIETKGQSKSNTKQTSDTLRISTKKLDSLLNQAEEMLSIKLSTSERSKELRKVLSKLHHLSQEVANVQKSHHSLSKYLNDKERDELPSELTVDLQKITQFIDWSSSFAQENEHFVRNLYRKAQEDKSSTASHIEELLSDVKDIITVPFSMLLDGYSKMIRDIARDLEKRVSFKVEGDDIEVDRRVLENLRTPLMHILRNSIDYGIEDAETRLKQGKPEKGCITISIDQPDTGSVRLSITDDGAGLNLEKLKRLYVEKENIDEKAVDGIKKEEYINYIFRSGISTSDIVTDLSGRGLGLAIVQEAIEQLEGKIQVESEPGKFTSFIITLPISILTFRGVILSVGKRHFIAPTSKVKSVMRTKSEDINTVENKATIQYEGEHIPVADLNHILGLNHEVEYSDDTYLIVLSSSNKNFAVAIDDILGEQEVLVKPFNRQLSRVRNISGATILGSGEVVPILNVADLLKTIQRNVSSFYQLENKDETSSFAQSRVLVVEDSITSRTLLKNVMETRGYEVTTAIDGMDGYNKLMDLGPFDAIMSDVEMPRMTGFDLCEKVRSTKEYERIPIVLITSLSKREDKERGVEVGANAYIVKGNFEQNNLFEILDSLIIK